MEDTTKNESTAAATDTTATDTQKAKEAELKARYTQVYSVGITVPVDDTEEKEYSYYFQRPTVPSYDRYIKTASQSITKASKAFMPVDLKQIKDLKQLLKLLAEIEDYTNGNGGDSDDLSPEPA